MILHENQLDQWLRCPLMDVPPAPAIERVARELMQWAFVSAFEGRVIAVKYLRRRADRLVQAAMGQDRSSDRYWSMIRAGGVVAGRIYRFLLHYEILKPIVPYEWNRGLHTIQGELVIAQKRTGVERPVVLSWHANRPVYYQSVPEYKSLCRWFAAMDDGFYDSLGIYNLALFTGRDWSNKTINEPLALRQVDSILEGIQRPVQIPRLGGHCQDCRAKPCQEIYRV